MTEEQITALDIPRMTLEQLRALRAAQDALLNQPIFLDVRVCMTGIDRGDHYFIIEDCRTSENVHHFLMFNDGTPDVAIEHKEYATMVEAALWYAYRFCLDNCDGADTHNPLIRDRHSLYQNALRDLIE